MPLPRSSSVLLLKCAVNRSFAGVFAETISEAATPSRDTFPDLRRQTRFDIHVGVDFAWSDQEGKEHEGYGLTRDISSLGTYIYAEAADIPPPGTQVRMEASLPSLRIGGRPINLRSRGTVVRANAQIEERQHGFAVENHVPVVLNF